MRSLMAIPLAISLFALPSASNCKIVLSGLAACR
jgi:hypothetical protein